jgi:Rrf2 family protein
MLTGKTSVYAIRALVYILIQNLEGKRPGFKEVAQKTGSPEPFTAKILQGLARAGIISSVKGRGGGFFFDDPLVPVPLYEVIRITEGEKFFTACGFGMKNCDSNNPCPFHSEYSFVRDGYLEMVKKQTIQLLAGRIRQNLAVLNR